MYCPNSNYAFIPTGKTDKSHDTTRNIESLFVENQCSNKKGKVIGVMDIKDFIISFFTTREWASITLFTLFLLYKLSQILATWSTIYSSMNAFAPPARSPSTPSAKLITGSPANNLRDPKIMRHRE